MGAWASSFFIFNIALLAVIPDVLATSTVTENNQEELSESSPDKATEVAAGAHIVKNTNRKKAPFNISRLQGRVDDNGCTSFTQSVFAQLPSQLFVLEVFDFADSCNRKEDIDSPEFSQVEVNIGGPFVSTKEKYIFGWVIRDRAAKNELNTLSAGLQINLSNMEWIKNAAARYKFHIFIQSFPIKSNEDYGDYDSLLYVSYKYSDSFDVRGTASLVHYDNEKDYFRLFSDFIYSINKSFDAYARYTYQNRDDQYYGDLGSQVSFGFRYNVRVK